MAPMTAAVVGFEYTLYQISGGAANLGLLVEYLVDGRDARAPVTVFDDDVFVGARLAANDTQDTAVLLGAMVDRSGKSTSIRLEAERRLGTRVVAELIGQVFTNVAAEDPLRAFASDSYLTLQLSYHF